MPFSHSEYACWYSGLNMLKVTDKFASTKVSILLILLETFQFTALPSLKGEIAISSMLTQTCTTLTNVSTPTFLLFPEWLRCSFQEGRIFQALETCSVGQASSRGNKDNLKLYADLHILKCVLAYCSVACLQFLAVPCLKFKAGTFH